MPKNRTKRIPLKELHQETGAHELAASPDMKPYLNFAMAVMQDADPTPELEAIRQLPLEKRYVWRIASALKWGFGDFEDLGVEADQRTLKPEDLATVMKVLKFRPTQFCVFQAALVGVEEMQRMMIDVLALRNSRSSSNGPLCCPDHSSLRREKVEQTTLRIVGWCFMALSAYIAYESGSALFRHETPGRSIAGISIAAAVIRNAAPCTSKGPGAAGVGSGAMHADSKQADFCA